MTDVASRPGDSERAPRPPKQEQEPASEEVTEVAPGVIRMQLPIWMPGLGHVNMYGLLDDRGLAVVDPGLPGKKSWQALKARLKTAGFSVKDIHTVVVTHSHPDHFRGPSLEELPALRDDEILDVITVEHQRSSVPWGGATPWGGSKHPMPPLSRRLMIRAMRLVFAPPDPTRRVKHGAPVQLAGRTWLAVHTPGHTLDHLCLFDPEHGILLSGDHVLPSITPHIAGSGMGDALHSYLATLDLVASLDGVKLGLPAHGHPFADVPGRVDAIKEHHFERMEKLRDASLATGPASVVTLSHELFPERHWGVMAESETFAHLEHLRGIGEAERWDDEGTLMYRVAPRP